MHVYFYYNNNKYLCLNSILCNIFFFRESTPQLLQHDLSTSSHDLMVLNQLVFQ